MSVAHVNPLTFETLAVRALNTARTVHLPTYAGLRLLVEAAGNDSAALVEFVGQRIPRSEGTFREGSGSVAALINGVTLVGGGFGVVTGKFLAADGVGGRSEFGDGVGGQGALVAAVPGLSALGLAGRGSWAGLA